MFGRLFRVLALSTALAFVLPSTALAQATATGGNVTFNAQFCQQVVNQAAAADQYNSGDAELAEAIAQNLDISQSAVNRCLQGGGGGSGASGATASAAGGEGGATATGGNVTINIQVCSQVVEQYANASQSNSGGGIAAGIAQDLGISQEAVNECIQGEVGGGDGPAASQYVESDEDDGLDEFRAGVLADTVPNKVLAATGGPSLLIPLSALVLGAGLAGFAVLRRG